MITPTVPDILEDQTILVTGGAGFLGSILLYRLLSAPFKPKRVITLIRGPNAALRLPTDLQKLVANAGPGNNFDHSKPLIVIEGDCSIRGFGVSEVEMQWLESVDIVIHAAANVRFNDPLKQAIASNSAMAYATAEFSATTPNVKTHIFISSCYTSFFLPSGSVFKEELVPTLENGQGQFGSFINTYSVAKNIAEGITNSFARVGGDTEFAIIRLGIVGPSMAFPKPAYGASSLSSPLSALMGAECLEGSSATYKGTGDTIPADICTDQILALTAKTHQDAFLPRRNGVPFHRGETVKVYHSVLPEAAYGFEILNAKSFKCKYTFVDKKTLIFAYKDILTKHIRFSNEKAKAAMATLDLTGLKTELDDPTTLGEEYFATVRRAVEKFIEAKQASKKSKQREARM